MREIIEFIAVNLFLLAMAAVSVAVCVVLIRLISEADLVDWLYQPLYALAGAFSIMVLYLSWRVGFDRLRRRRSPTS